MRIVWAGIGPWHKSGYGIGTATFPRRLRDLGHQVTIAVMGEKDGPRATLNHPDAAETKRTGLWDGMRVIGPGASEFALPGRDRVRVACGGTPDLVIVLKDAWVLRGADYRGYRAAVWLAFDTDPLGVPDQQFFAGSGARPVCTSRWGLSRARAAGLDALYVPFGIDTALWSPGPRQAARDLLGLPHDVFVAGIDGANVGPRKGWGEQLGAFAQFHAKHPKSLLLIHSAKRHEEGIDLEHLRDHLGLQKAVVFPSHLNMRQAQMLTWYRSLDVLMMGTYGEGWGLPITQAHACGVPVIGTDCTAISEKIPHGTGWLAKGQRWWNPHHQSWWTIPSETQLARCLERAYRGAHAGPQVIREHALKWDADLVVKKHWAPVLEELTA